MAKRKSRTNPMFLIVINQRPDGRYTGYFVSTSGRDKSDMYGPFDTEQDAIDCLELEIADYE